MAKEEITLNEFIKLSTAFDNRDGSWSVSITLKDSTKSTLTVDNCNNEFDAKERAYLYLITLIEK